MEDFKITPLHPSLQFLFNLSPIRERLLSNLILQCGLQSHNKNFALQIEMYFGQDSLSNLRESCHLAITGNIINGHDSLCNPRESCHWAIKDNIINNHENHALHEYQER